MDSYLHEDTFEVFAGLGRELGVGRIERLAELQFPQCVIIFRTNSPSCAQRLRTIAARLDFFTFPRGNAFSMLDALPQRD